MRTNHIYAANCAATLASARGNFGGACQTTKVCGSTRRGLAGAALATTYYIPLLMTLNVAVARFLNLADGLPLRCRIPMPGALRVLAGADEVIEQAILWTHLAASAQGR